MAHERICMVCGKKYEYCAHGCKDFDESKPWMYLFDDETCKNVYDIWQSMRGKEINKEKAAEIFGAMDLTKVLAADTMVAKEVKEIVKTKKETHVEEKHETVKEETKKEETHQGKKEFKRK